MKKEIIITTIIEIIAIIAIILIIAGFIFYKINNPENRLEKLYNKMISNQTYIFSRSNQNEENKVVTTRKGNNTIIDMYNLGEHTTTLVKEGDTYVIIHSVQEYYVYENNNNDESILTDELKRIIEKEHTVGEEEINGEKYYYEQYDGETDFLIYSYKDMAPETVKTKFYFKGRKLKYIKTEYKTVDSETGETKEIEELLKVDVKYKVKDDVFEIPSTYAEN